MIRTKVLKFCKQGKRKDEIMNHLGLSNRQTRNIIKVLEEEGVLNSAPVLQDLRMKQWTTVLEKTPVTI